MLQFGIRISSIEVSKQKTFLKREGIQSIVQ